MPMLTRKKRDIDSQFNGPYYNLSGIVEESLIRINKNEKNERDIKEIQKEIHDLIRENENQKIESLRRLTEAERSQNLYRIGFITLIGVLLLSIFGVSFLLRRICHKTNLVRIQPANDGLEL